MKIRNRDPRPENRATIYLVGGFIRDCLLNRKTEDIDVVVSTAAKGYARRFAEKNRGKFVYLDEINRIYRVIINRGGKNPFHIDFSAQQGRIFVNDLWRRDFTINAIALKLADENLLLHPANLFKEVRKKRNKLIDPFNGQQDLRKKIIRAISEKSFLDDPLRQLRAFRFAGQLNFKIDEEIFWFLEKYKALIKKISAERIRDELMKIFSFPDSFLYISQMDKLGLLSPIIPEIDSLRNVAPEYYLRGGVWGHSLDTLKELEKIFQNSKKIFPRFFSKLKTYLEEKISNAYPRKVLLKLAALLHDLGKPITMQNVQGRVRFFGHEEKGEELIVKIAQRLRLSRREQRILALFSRQHMRPANLSKQKVLTERAVYRFFRDLGYEGVGLLLVSLADVFTYEKNIGHLALTRKMLSYYYFKKKTIKPKRLVDGNILMDYLKTPPGPTIGKILAAIEEAQAVGKVKTKKQALDWAKKIYVQ